MNKILLWFFGTRLGARIELQVLMNLVTASLSLPARIILTMPYDEALLYFAKLTSGSLPTCLPKQRERLYRKSYALGHGLRSMLTDRSDSAIARLVIQLYRNIGIEMEREPKLKVLGWAKRQSRAKSEKLKVKKCFFSEYYKPDTCALASLMDSGVIEGLYGRGRLQFSQRITEGCDCCKCYLRNEESNNNR